jgi:hypothetical protein
MKVTTSQKGMESISVPDVITLVTRNKKEAMSEEVRTSQLNNWKK